MKNVIELFVLAIIALTGLFLAWFFVRRARFKEKITLIEKGIDIKNLNSIGNHRTYSPWLRIGIIIVGTGFGALIIALTNFNPNSQEALIFVFLGVSVILAYFIDSPKS